MHITTINETLCKTLHQQAEEAFSEKPDLSGVVHGRRRITQGARGRRTALFPSRKNGVTIALESQLELSFCLLFERNPEVSGYRCQSLELELSDDKRYFPDFLIRTKNDRWLVREIKPNRRHLTDEIHERHEIVEKLLRSCDFDFAVVDQTDLPGRVQLENLAFLYQRSAIRAWAQQELDMATELIIRLSEPKPLNELYTRFTEVGLSPLLIDHMLFCGDLFVNLDRPLRLDVLVRIQP